jgi:hypothetical protein
MSDTQDIGTSQAIGLATSVQGGAASLDLPSAATLNQDGSVTFVLAHPIELKIPAKGNNAAQVEHVDRLVLYRLAGSEVRKVRAAPNPAQRAQALSLRISLERLAAIQAKIDAQDRTAVANVVYELMGRPGSGLPANAEETADGIRLHLRRSVMNEAGETIFDLHFGPLTEAQKRVIPRSQSPMDWGLAAAAGISPKAAKAIIDQMDGADAIAVTMVLIVLIGGSMEAK